MKRQFLFKALTLGLSASAIILTSCSTTESRISDHPEIFNSLSPRDQALVRQGQIRTGMSQNAVWLAWGSPEQKNVGVMRGHQTETWIYVTYVTPYGYGYGYGYPGAYGYRYPGPYGFGFGGVGFVHRHHHGRSFFFFGDPFYDPFFYSYIPPSIPVPYRTVTFSNGRVVSFQYLAR
jgi:hypothetical protein